MAKTDAHALLGLMAAQPCAQPSCDGVLERGRYKGTDAVICSDCEIPAVRAWEP